MTSGYFPVRWEYYTPKPTGLNEKVRINENIRARELRVIEEGVGNLGVLPLAEALAAAKDKGLDLIEVSPLAVPPVAKIMDYGKYQYQEKKKEQLAKAKSHVTETKNIQVKPGTGEHDLELKASKASEFLREGHRVKIELFLRGRSKYLDQKFLKGRLERLLKFISEDFKVAIPAMPGPKGLILVIERDKVKGSPKEPSSGDHPVDKPAKIE